MNQKIMQKIEVVARQLGMRVREVRQKQGITLETLSRETDLSASFLSRLERGETSASIANLIMIATRLGIPLRDFFDEPSADSSRDYVLTRASQRVDQPALTAHGYTYQLSSGDLPDQQMSAFELSFSPEGHAAPKLLTHDGEEVLYLIEGTIEFQIGEHTFVMQSGDCVHFNCSKPHMGRNIGKTRARMLMVVAPVHTPGTSTR
jgi:transcriptional regulator with XRE-family HTH domain